MEILEENPILTLCRGIEVDEIYERGRSDGQVVSFDAVLEGISYHISICNRTESTLRTITIKSENNLDAIAFWRAFNVVDELLMMLDGRFFPLFHVAFIGDDVLSLSKAAEFLKTNRLNMYKSADFARHAHIFSLKYQDIINAQIFSRWISIREDLDILHFAMLYNMADTGLTIDWKCANMIEMFEALAELIHVYDPTFPIANSEDKNVTIKLCMDEIISRYGNDIFDREYEVDKDKFLSLFKWSRNRIMHIKRRQPSTKFLSGNESALYAVKLSFLYRKTILLLLGIDYGLFKENLKNSVNKWNEWEGVLDSFILAKLS